MASLFSKNSSVRTCKFKKNIPAGTNQYKLQQYMLKTLGAGNLRDAVVLPPNEDMNEWIAVNSVDFFNQTNLLYETIAELCTEKTCPIMRAGPNFEYHWADGYSIKKPIKCSAPRYIDYLMTWAEQQLENEELFPSKRGVPFPKNFVNIAKKILKRLFRVYAHIYHHHFNDIISLDQEAHLNTTFKHLVFFSLEFNLIDEKEMLPMKTLINALTKKPVDPKRI